MINENSLSTYLKPLDICAFLYTNPSLCTLVLLYLNQCNIKISLAPEGAKQGNLCCVIICLQVGKSGRTGPLWSAFHLSIMLVGANTMCLNLWMMVDLDCG